MSCWTADVESLLKPELCGLLRKYKAVIAGGFILKAIHNGDWDTDIDIFTSNGHIISDLINMGGVCSKKAEEYDGDFIKPQLISVTSIHSNNILKIPNKNIKIDVVLVRDVKYAIGEFDLDFCKVWYDGTTVATNHFCAVYNKISTGLTADCGDRAEKYRARGFTIIE